MNRLWPCLCAAVAAAGCGDTAIAPAAPYFDLRGNDPTKPMDFAVPPDLAVPPLLEDGGPPEDLSLVDKTGPRIVFVSPLAGDFVAGIISVDIDISDPSGVDDGSVQVTLGASNGNPGVPVPIVRSGQTEHFHGVVDTRLLTKNFVLPLLTVKATDKAVPATNTNEISETVIIDNVNPAIDLDPPNNHHIVKSQAMKFYCSHPFDPVGDWSVNDGEIIQQLSVIRARVEDRGNIAPGQTLEYVSTIKPGSVKLYIAPVSYGPMVVDGNMDPEQICDDVNPALVPIPGGMNNKKATMVVLDPIPATGSANFVIAPNLADPVCGALGLLPVGDPNTVMPPPLICFNDLTIHLSYTNASKGMPEPSIWSIPPIGNAPGQLCEGVQFDAANSKLPEGPLCAAVVAYDVAGNRNVSRPLRLCYDNGGGQCRDYVRHGGVPNLNNLPDCGMAACKPGVQRNAMVQGNSVREDPFVSRVTYLLQ